MNMRQIIHALLEKKTDPAHHLLAPVFGLKVLAIVLSGLLMPFGQTAKAGCPCMMDSKSIGASYNKTGFSEGCSTNQPPQIYLHQKIRTWTKGEHSEIVSQYYHIKWNQFEVDESSYSLTSSNIYRSPADGCKTYTLPYTSSNIYHGNGELDTDYD